MSDNFDEDLEIAKGGLSLFALAIIVIVLLGSVISLYNGWFSILYQKTFGVQQEDVKREQYEHTKSFKDGTVLRLQNLCTQVSQAADDQKGSLNNEIAHEFPTMNTSDAPDYLQSCLKTARGQ